MRIIIGIDKRLSGLVIIDTDGNISLSSGGEVKDNITFLYN